MNVDKTLLESLVTIEGIITQGKQYRCIGETENYYVIKSDLNKHEVIRKHFFKKY